MTDTNSIIICVAIGLIMIVERVFFKERKKEFAVAMLIVGVILLIVFFVWQML